MFLKKTIDGNKLIYDIYSKKKLERYAFFLIGVCLQALAFNLFFFPNDIICGVSGISIIVNKLLNVNPAYTMLVLNILLIIASFVYLGKEITRHTILGALLYPVLVQLTSNFYNIIDLGATEPVINVITGAAMYGIGTGLIFKGGYSTGGTDVLKQIVSKYMKVSIGRSTTYVEMVIIICGVFVFGWQAFIYSIISLFIISIITDRVVLGTSNYKTFQILTNEYETVEKFIIEQLHHGVTVINNRSSFTDKEKILLCTIPTREYFIVKEALLRIDKDAFFIVTDTYEVQGGK